MLGISLLPQKTNKCLDTMILQKVFSGKYGSVCSG
jgi:hypothetical protein